MSGIVNTLEVVGDESKCPCLGLEAPGNAIGPLSYGTKNTVRARRHVGVVTLETVAGERPRAWRHLLIVMRPEGRPSVDAHFKASLITF